MHVVTNAVRRGDREYRSTLLRRSFREGGKVRKETLANLSHLPDEVIELIRGALAGRRSRWRAASSSGGCSTARRRASATCVWR
jgi:hypothetical protein